MGQDGFDVNTEEMRSHAQSLRDVAATVGKGKDAAGEVSLNGTDAYGILCSPILTPLIGAIEIQGLATIGTAQAAVDATAGAIDGAASTYDEIDKQVSERIQAILDELRS